MSKHNALIIRQPSKLAQRPPHALSTLSPRQIVPAAGAALALTWGLGKLFQRLWANRHAQTSIEPQPPLAPPAKQISQPVIIYRATWSITVIGKREHHNN